MALYEVSWHQTVEAPSPAHALTLAAASFNAANLKAIPAPPTTQLATMRPTRVYGAVPPTIIPKQPPLEESHEE